MVPRGRGGCHRMGWRGGDMARLWSRLMPTRGLFWMLHDCGPDPNMWSRLFGRTGDQRRRFHASGDRSFCRSLRKRRLISSAPQIRIDDDLAVVAQVHRLQFLKLLPPFAQVGKVNFEAVEII